MHTILVFGNGRLPCSAAWDPDVHGVLGVHGGHAAGPLGAHRIMIGSEYCTCALNECMSKEPGGFCLPHHIKLRS